MMMMMFIGSETLVTQTALALEIMGIMAGLSYRLFMAKAAAANASQRGIELDQRTKHHKLVTDDRTPEFQADSDEVALRHCRGREAARSQQI